VGAVLVAPRDDDSMGDFFDVHAFNLHDRWFPASSD
jgi:hypothetical protein